MLSFYVASQMIIMLCVSSLVAPEIDRSPAFSKAAAEKGSSAKLICKAEGAPEVTFKWFKVSTCLYLSLI